MNDKYLRYLAFGMFALALLLLWLTTGTYVEGVWPLLQLWMFCVLGTYANVVWLTRGGWLIYYTPWDLPTKQKIILHSGTASALLLLGLLIANQTGLIGAYLWSGSFLLLSISCHLPTGTLPGWRSLRSIEAVAGRYRTCSVKRSPRE